MAGNFPMRFIQPPQRIPHKDRIPPADDPLSSFRSSEIQAMNQEFQDDLRLQEAGHND